MYVARTATHIQDDIKRNWSSWNFGQGGFEGTREELDAELEKITDEKPFFISGFEIFTDNLKDCKFGELYENYWVLIDEMNTPSGLSCIELDSENEEDVIKEALSRKDYFGEGDSFDAREATLIHSENDIHVFFIED